MRVQVNNETAPLEAVVLGIGGDRGAPRTINPMVRHHIRQGTYPTDEAILAELAGFAAVLEAEGVRVFRPYNLPETDQIFSRDIAFVIEDKLIYGNMKKDVRQNEIEGISRVLAEIESEQVHLPPEVCLEGGDVVLWGDHIFVGVGERSNRAGVAFLADLFPEKEVVGLELIVTDDPGTNILHLDCTFQPIGEDEAIFFEEGFKARPEPLFDLFAEKKLLRVNRKQMNRMCPNIFSLSPEKIVIEKQFHDLKAALLRRGYQVIDIPYAETSKLGGLLRCSTLPLRRSF